LLDALEDFGDTGLAEIFLRQDVGRHLRPARRYLHVLELEHDRAIRIADLAGRGSEFDPGKRARFSLGVPTFDVHSSKVPKMCGQSRPLPPPQQFSPDRLTLYFGRPVATVRPLAPCPAGRPAWMPNSPP